MRTLLLQRKMWLLALCAVVLAACGGDNGGSLLSVSVATGLVPGHEFNSVLTDVTRLDGDGSTLPPREARVVFSDGFARGKGVAEFDNLSPGRYSVFVRLLRLDGTILVSRRVQIELVADFNLVVHLTRDCVGVVCPAPAGSPALSECLSGTCVDPRCNPPDPTFCPDITFCVADADCPATASCATGVCTLGVCEADPNASACTPPSYCNPDPVSGGCVMPVVVDGGVDAAVDADAGTDAGDDASMLPDLSMPMEDAGEVDASMPEGDAGPICGTICTSEADPCVFGYWDCSEATPVCTEINFKPAGSTCGGGRTCTLEHECVFCEEGSACSFYCYAGTVSCGSGSRECVLDGSLLPEGSPFSDSYCYSDAPCGSGQVCDASGSPVDCIMDAPCGTGCDVGHMECDLLGAHCILDGVAAPGTTCGVNQVCDPSGTCIACAAGSSCTTPDPRCQTGLLSCDTGTPVCNVTTRAPGTYCGFFAGANHVCGPTGTCDVCNSGGACVLDSNVCQRAFTSCNTGVPVCTGTTGLRLDPGTMCDTDKVCDWDATCKYCVPGASCTSANGCATGTYACDFVYGAGCSGATTPLPLGTACATGVCNGTDTCCSPITATHVAVSTGMFCYISSDTRAHCTSDTTHALDLTNVVGISVGSNFGCALQSGGSVSCWGSNDGGQLGFIGAGSATAVPISLPGIAHEVQSGGYSSCAIVGASRDVYCWGYEEIIRHDFATSDVTPTQVPGLTGVAELAIESYHFCARLLSGDVKCWGYNFSGEGGDGTTSGSAIDTPVTVVGIHDAIDIDVADGRSCAVRATGDVMCWGVADVAGGPFLTATARTLPFHDALRVEVTSQSTRCVLRSTGEVWCFDHGAVAGIGYDASTMTIAPTAVHSIASATDLNMDADVGCAIGGATSEIYCWGNDGNSQFSPLASTYYEPILVCP